MTEARVSLPAPRNTPYGMLRAAPFIGDATQPSETEIVIIGGGICGALTAYYLAKRGVPVLLCEKAEMGCEASSRAFGWVSELLLDPIKLPMTLESKALWQDVQRDAGETGFRQHGLAFMAESEGEMEFYKGWLDGVAGMCSPDTVMLTAAEAAARYPGTSRPFVGGLFAPTDGSAEPIIATAAIAEAARKAGAKIVTGCAVRGLDLQGGRVAGVFTEKGHVKASQVLCAANAWSRIFCGNHGIDIPQIYVIMSMGRSGPIDGALHGPVGAGAMTNGGAWREQIDGSYSLGGQFLNKAPVTRDAIALKKMFEPLMTSEMGTAKLDFGRNAWNDLRLKRKWRPDGVSPFEKLRILSGEAAAGYADQSIANARDMFPAMENSAVIETWSGAVPLTPDNVPIADSIATIPGFHVLTGLSYGMTWGPSMAKMMADVMTGAATSIDPAPFRLSRFTDGSPIVVRH